MPAGSSPTFERQVTSSDAESGVGSKLSGVPHWENQRKCTNELTAKDLVGHELVGRLL